MTIADRKKVLEAFDQLPQQTGFRHEME